MRTFAVWILEKLEPLMRRLNDDPIVLDENGDAFVGGEDCTD